MSFHDLNFGGPPAAPTGGFNVLNPPANNTPGGNLDFSSLGNFGNSFNPIQSQSILDSGGNSASFFDNLDFGNISKGLQGLGGVAQSFLGLKNFGLQKDAFEFQKDAFNANFANSAKTTNAALTDRQARRNLESPGQSTPVAEYLAEFGVQGKI